MEPVETADVPVDVDAIVGVLEAHPVRIGILFGSRAGGTTHSRSDVDVAVELDGLRPGDEGYNEAFFGLSAELSLTLETDDVDLVDVHSCPPSVVEGIFEDGVLMLGDERHAEALRRQPTGGATDERSPRERPDELLSRIDEHLA